MAQILDENRKPLRQKMRVEIKINDEGYGRPDSEILSCYLDLRGVETTYDNPDFQTSEIQVELLPSDPQDFYNRYRDEDITLTYRAGYFNNNEADDVSDTRTFYATLDDSNFTLNGSVVTIRATDYAAKVTDQHPGAILKDTYRDSDYTGYTKMALKRYMYEILKPFMPDLTEPGASDTSTNGIYNLIFDWQIFDAATTDSGYDSAIFIEPQSRRKLVAQFMNLFRGTTVIFEDTAMTRELRKKFIFRDAGRPEAGWLSTAASQYSSSINIRSFDIGYNEVSDLKVSSLPVQRVLMDNPNIDLTATVVDPESTITGYKYIGALDVVKNKRYVYNTSDPYCDFNWRWTNPDSSISENATMISPYSVAFTARATQNLRIHGIPITKKYVTSDMPNIDVQTGSRGKTLELEPFNGLGYQLYKKGEDRLWTNLPKELFFRRPCDQIWYEFKWRGNPHMQPYDLISFTEKDGTYNHYEVERVTFEHKDGGLISEVKMRRIIEATR